ncbi:MAG TPA: TRAP transporter small permease [Anaerohalosphaeraceae bacterium]|nr:TRAP transporter small permease [Anaerohalosphaeraceae bacterium]HOL89307.1 TRAP transporter small permease [Anaerohalosphaeraceae bacterium]HPP56892.1 TRAP transporter small permease [Anaerohalosphaeraceae bacterium]
MRRLIAEYERLLRAAVLGLAGISGLSVLAMTAVTVADVFLRKTPWAFAGTYDLIKVLGAISISAALPYTTAVKGHVAIEFFYHKLGRTGRLILDVFLRVLSIGLLGLAVRECVRYGQMLHRTGQVSQTLQMPIFWLPYFFAGCLILMILVKFYHTTHPGKVLLKP